MSSALSVWMNGELVGHWRVDRGASTLTYAASWLASAKVRSLSVSLPITASREVRGPVVTHFFDNLLPDNDRIRARLARRFKTRDAETFSLLEAIGRDCVGAVQLLPEAAEPTGWNRIQADRLTRHDVRKLLDAVPAETVLGTREDDDLFRISLAGAQEKTALLKVKGQFFRPHGATPTTHILKLPLGLVGGSRRIDLSNSIENEWLCAQLVRELGLPIASAEIEEFAGLKALVVERFDRQWMDGARWIARLPQEDFCQALGIAPGKKYEKDGGPGMESSLKLLAGAEEPDSDRAAFQLAQLAFWLMAATDGHAKNFSLFLRSGDTYTMTPLYDVISAWPYIGDGAHEIRWRSAGLAMAIRAKNTHHALHTIQARHWHGLAMQHGGPAIWQAMKAMVNQVDAAIAAVGRRLPKAFPASVWEPVTRGMQAQARLFAQGVAAAKLG